MATLQGGSIGIDMFSGFDGVIVIARADLIQVSYGGGWFGNYWGSYQYSGTSLAGGTINGYEEVINGERIVSVTGFSVSATSVFSRVAVDDTVGVLNLVFAGSDSLLGSSGNDTLVGLGGNDGIDGGAGNDDINGNLGNDIMLGGAGADWVRGGQGNDTISGSDGDDPHVNGNLGNDFVFGYLGNDTLYGGQGNDSIAGEAGDDLLSGDIGSDELLGGPGADRFYLHANSQLDLVRDFNGAEGDRVALPAGQAYTIKTVGGMTDAVISIQGQGGEQWLVLLDVTPAQFQSSWVVFI